ncbi:steroidogenic acute regulatory protein, mitochondrial [Nematolebias whitei]|uniref:steroidogenic acute regulatory protein, mitochondrial n=1 Tax=Nematolebias whitei TaxID=451745 RepID=UPI001897BC60|nr:steroidogenic acute regulatory protein, mitochondrial [Nematolebias whitei]
MLPAVVKLCCGISYPHLRSMAGLQRTAVAVIGQEITHLKQWGRIQHLMGAHAEPKEKSKSVNEDELFYVQHGREAMMKALSILDDRGEWTVEIEENNGDVIYSKVIAGTGTVFKLEAVLEASVNELYDLLFVRVEEMPRWNPNIQQIKVLKQVGPETVVTHEVTAEMAGNVMGQRDFLSVRHSCKQDSCVYLGGAAIQLESFPPQTGFVRAEDRPTCIIIRPLDKDTTKSSFTWLLNMDIKGWLPTSIVNHALPQAQLAFTRHLRRHLSLR